MLSWVRKLTCLGLTVLMGYQAMVATLPSRADSAPMWESPVGLKPGLVDNRVRMVAETVDLRVIERDGAVYAVVSAVFDLLNNGPDTKMKVGFPEYNYPVNVGEYPKQVGFSPSQLGNFRAWAGVTQYQPRRERVVLDPSASSWGDEWFVWDMAFPRGVPVRLNVGYDQKLSEGNGAVNLFYVLTSGALWDGTIGEATVIATARDGGAFVAADPAAGESSTSRVVWQMRDFEPTEDVRAVYVPATTWQTLRAAEDAITAGRASAIDYISGARAVHWMTEDGTRAGEEREMLRQQHYPRGLEWARQAVELEGENWEAWEVLADLEDATAKYPKGMHKCWSQPAADAYQQAADLGSPTAPAKLADLLSEREWIASTMLGPLEPCP
ncbi:MAG: DUF4424 domain-containing protein [Chloroflexi bacterium]|nr:DUF4424 domain-containing protein [Chloroflexota bacterium]